MDINQNPLLLKYLVAQDLFCNEPFVYFDVGCSGGVDNKWLIYENQIEIHAFDPQQSEIVRLRKENKNGNIMFHSYYVGMEESFSVSIFKQEGWLRSSAASLSVTQPNNIQTNCINMDLTSDRISLDDFIQNLESQRNLKGPDFIKIDCDGGDFEVLMSCKKNLEKLDILGFLIECNFLGTADVHSNSFHNIDRVLKTYSYQPYLIDMYKYSRSYLPNPFIYDIYATTHSGSVFWGDVLFLLDVCGESFKKLHISNEKLLKLLSLFDLFNLQDCAAELLIKYRFQLEKEVNVDLMLNLLTEQIAPGLNYIDYMNIIKNDPSILFPKNENKRKEIFKNFQEYSKV